MSIVAAQLGLASGSPAITCEICNRTHCRCAFNEKYVYTESEIQFALILLWHARVHLQASGAGRCDCKEIWRGPTYGAKEFVRHNKCAYHILHDMQASIALDWHRQTHPVTE